MAKPVAAAKNRTVAALLERQPAAFRAHPAYPRLVARLRVSPVLARVRLDPIAFRLLDKARIEAKNLENLYVNRRLPRDPFFPLFLVVKREIAELRAQARRARDAAIAATVDSFPSEIRDFIIFLAKLEKRLNPRCPLWRGTLYPRTKKRAAELAAFSYAQWIELFGPYLELLRRRYVDRPELRPMDPEKLLACMALRCLPDPETLRWPSDAEVKAAYRRLSKTVHPDAGGDVGLFRLITLAKETLLP